MPEIYVYHRDLDFNIRFTVKRIRQAKSDTILFIVSSVVKANAFRCRSFLLCRAVSVIVPALLNVFAVYHSCVDQETHRHIRIKCGLLFIEAHRIVDQKRYIVFHAHIDSVLYGIQLDRTCVCIV